MFKENQIGLIVVAENTCIRDDLLAQHGVSFRIYYYGKRYLFDCAQIYSGITHNLKSLNLDVNDIEAIIISHDHRDHCFALGELLADFPKTKTYVTSDFSSIQHKNIVKVEKSLEIEKGLFLTGSLDSKEIKEQSLVIDLVERGLVIVSGCSHPGLNNIVKEAIKITGNKKIAGIIGGLHLAVSSKDEIQESIIFLKGLNLEFLIPGHCTGIDAIISIKEQLGDIVKLSPMGSIGTGNTMCFAPEFSFDMRGR